MCTGVPSELLIFCLAYKVHGRRRHDFVTGLFVFGFMPLMLVIYIKLAS